MRRVITYGTFDLLHFGHVRLLERAKALGDYLVVGITADGFDKIRGKINVQQSLVERIEAVQKLGIADEIIVEEYEGQKIDDIKKYSIDVFTVGSDWIGQFDYLKEYCEVIYLDRTAGVSSSEIRSEQQPIKLGVVGDSLSLNKFVSESGFVNGIETIGICTDDISKFSEKVKSLRIITNDYDTLLKNVDAVHIHSAPVFHFSQVKKALIAGKHVMCESPLTLNVSESKELIDLANEKGLVLQECIRTAYCTAYSRLLVLLKTGIIGDIVSIDATCTTLNKDSDAHGWNSVYSWGPVALLPVFDILGTNIKSSHIYSAFFEKSKNDDMFTKANFFFGNAVASIKVARGVKSEGDLIIAGTKGFAYVPSPWWKTSYFEVRYENPNDNKKYFYQFEGDGLRYEIADFRQEIRRVLKNPTISRGLSLAITKVMQDFCERLNFAEINI